MRLGVRGRGGGGEERRSVAGGARGGGRSGGQGARGGARVRHGAGVAAGGWSTAPDTAAPFPGLWGRPGQTVRRVIPLSGVHTRGGGVTC